MKNHLLIQFISSFAIVLLVSACESIPSEGEMIVLKVDTLIADRSELILLSPTMFLAINNGVTKSDIKNGRLVNSGCYHEDLKSRGKDGTNVRSGYVLLPDNSNIQKGDLVEIALENSKLNDGGYSRYFGRFVRKVQRSPEYYFYHKYAVSNKAFKCQRVSQGKTTIVEVHSTARVWIYDHTKKEMLINEMISDEEINDSQVIIGVCTPGTDSMFYWKVKLPSHLSIQKDDYLTAAAGPFNALFTTGPIAYGIKKIDTPSPEQFGKVFSTDMVKCNAGYELE